ncbi:MAG: hypothetical protein HY873_10165 [Chloroflexi bacterium]|nr:hypothetical protein [Chloroflexota bacterium]
MIAALAIIAVTAFVVIAQVADGNAGTGPAPLVVVVVYDDHMSPPLIEVRRGQILELRFDNQAKEVRTMLAGGEGVEQLPELPKNHEAGAFKEPRPYVSVDVSPGRSESVLVRFTKKGEYELGAFVPGTYTRLELTRVLVK